MVYQWSSDIINYGSARVNFYIQGNGMLLDLVAPNAGSDNADLDGLASALGVMKDALENVGFTVGTIHLGGEARRELQQT